jgi:uncharacterized protein (TIGR02996 family)
MTDHDALLAAICDQPDEDTPRLAFADWLDENDQTDRAAFVRAQVELARTPPWEPFAVLCKWRRPDWFTGRPFRHTLPPVDGRGVEWHPEAFRRGFGWRLNVRSLVAWEQEESAVVGRAPVGEIYLWTAPLDDWIRFAASPVVGKLRRLHFMNNPIEPMRVLRDTPEALGITDVHFERASGAGMPFVVEDLLASPLGKILRGLHFHVGYESLEDLIDALAPATALERLSFATMGLTDVLARRLLASLSRCPLSELDFRNNPLGAGGVWNVLYHLPAGVHTLGLADTGATGRGFDVFSNVTWGVNLRRLDISRNPLTPRTARALARASSLAGLRSLDASACRVGERELRHLTRAKFWPNLVELDLRANPIPPAGVRHLLNAEVPADLAALVLDGEQLGSEARAKLQKRYGERVVFPAESP